GAASEELGEPLFRARAGEVVRLAATFHAHFTRGHYSVHINVRDSRAGVCHMFAESVATFAVNEQVSYGGVVNIEPAIRIDHDTRPLVPTAIDARLDQDASLAR